LAQEAIANESLWDLVRNVLLSAVSAVKSGTFSRTVAQSAASIAARGLL
jgi:hypothetical protein